MGPTESEQAWLKAYREALVTRYAGALERMILYGSKARGDAGPDSDLDILLIVGEQAAALKRPMRRTGYLLAAGTEVVPSILAYTRDEWAKRKQSGSPFQRAVERDEVRLL
jgi:predicted nucleotidyltransferase